MAVRDRLLEQIALFLAGDDDGDRLRRQDRRSGQRHARDGRIGRQRVGHHTDRAARVGGIQGIVEIGPGKDRGGVAVLAHPQPDEIGRPRQILQPRISRAAGQLVIVDPGRDREHPSAGFQEGLGDRADVALLAVERNQPIVGRDDRDLLPRKARLRQLGVDGQRRGPPRKRDQRTAPRIERALDDEADVPGDCLGQLFQRLIVPPFGFDHFVVQFSLIATAAFAHRRPNPQPAGRLD